MKLFKKSGWIYLPISIAGYAIGLVAVVASIWVFVVSANNPDSTGDSLYSAIPFFVSIWVIYGFIASNCSNNHHKFKKNEKINNNSPRQLRNGDGIDTYGGTLYILVGYFIDGIF